MYKSLDEAMEAFEPKKNKRVALLNTTKGVLVLSQNPHTVPSHSLTLNFYFYMLGQEEWNVSGDVSRGTLADVLEWLNRRFGDDDTSGTEEEQHIAALVAATKAHRLALKMDKLLKPQPTE